MRFKNIEQAYIEYSDLTKYFHRAIMDIADQFNGVENLCDWLYPDDAKERRDFKNAVSKNKIEQIYKRINEINIKRGKK